MADFDPEKALAFVKKYQKYDLNQLQEILSNANQQGGRENDWNQQEHFDTE